MKKSIVPVLVSLVSLVSFSARAEVSAELLKKYYWGEYNFDGNKVSNSNKSAVNFDNTAKTVTAKGKSGEYTMAWAKENINDSDVFDGD